MPKTNPSPKRRWLRFSLRTLLIVVVLLSLFLGWFVHPAVQQRRVVEAIREAGGIAYYDYQMDEPGRFTRKELPAPAWLTELVGVDLFGDVVHVDFVHALEPETSDLLLGHLRGMTSLKILCLSDTQATEEGIEELQKSLPICTIEVFPSPDSKIEDHP